MSSPPHVLNFDGVVFPDGLNHINANFADIYSRLDSAAASAIEWLANSFTPLFVDASNFTLAGDQTSLHAVGRMVRAHLDSGYVYAAISASSYDGGTELTTVTLGAAVLDDTLDGVELGILTPGADSAVPGDVLRTFGDQSVAGHKDLTGAILSVAAPTADAHPARKADLDAVEIDLGSDLGDLETQVAAEHNADGTHKHPGVEVGGASWVSNNQLRFDKRWLWIEDGWYKIPSDLTVTFSGLPASGDAWIYVEKPASGIELADAQFSHDATAPTKDGLKAGWYNAAGDKRCIFMIITNASSQFIEFRCNGRLVLYDNPILDADTITPSNVWADVGLSVPVLGGLVALVTAFSRYGNANATSYVRTNGSSATTGQRLGYVTVNLAERHHSHVRVVVDSAAKVEVKYQVATTNPVSLYSDGFELMEGM